MLKYNKIGEFVSVQHNIIERKAKKIIYFDNVTEESFGMIFGM